MFRVAVCDDEKEVLKELRHILKQEYQERIEVICVSNIVNYIKQLKAQEQKEPDVVIMDIKWHMTAQAGIDVSVSLQQMFPKLKIIFLTGYIEYAVDIFKARPSNFLVKPISRERLRAALDKVFAEILRDRSRQIVLCSKGEVISLDAENVLYVESDKHELVVHCLQEDRHIWMKLDEFLESAGSEFIRIHQSYAVNAVYVQRITADGVEMVNDLFLPVSRRRYNKVKNAFLDYLEAGQEIAE